MPDPFHLLVIDDQSTDLLLVQELLEHTCPEVQVRPMAYADDLVTRCQTGPQRPHLILLDLHLGPVSGLTILSQLKADPATRTIPVIVFSGTNRQEDVRQAYEAGASGYLVKPFPLDQFQAVLQHLVAYWRRVPLVC